MIKKGIFVIFSFIFSIIALSVIAVYLKSLEGDPITLIDGFYWVISTITTVGYGDIVFVSGIGKLFSVFVQLFGIAFIFGIAFPYLIMPWVERRLLISLPDEVRLSRHLVIFGYTNITPFLCDHLKNLNVKYVIVETDRNKVIEALEKGYTAIISDLSKGIIENAKINEALAVIVMWDDVEKSLDVLLTLKDVKTRKYAVLSDPFYSRYLHYASVERVITPKVVIGAQLAKIILERHTGFIDVREVFPNYGVTQIIIPKNSFITGFTVKEVEEHFKVKIIAICEYGKMNFNPDKSFRIKVGHNILVFGEKNNLIRFYEGVY